jgi:hypothetical protein
MVPSITPRATHRRRGFFLVLTAIMILPIAAFAQTRSDCSAAGACGAPAGFQILVDTNQIQPAEAPQAARFAADGVWSIPLNSPHGIDWTRTLSALDASRWSVSEDNPGATSQADLVSTSMHRMVDGAMFYNEDGLATPLSDAQIAQYAAHVVPGLGAIGARIVLLTRSFGDGDPRQLQLRHALANPNVSGATFEFSPDTIKPAWKLDAGCSYILSLHKKCYLLMPPKRGTLDYVGNIEQAIAYFGKTKALLTNPNVYIVLAVYGRPNTVHYISTSGSDRDSIEAAVAWLKAYRADPLHPPL